MCTRRLSAALAPSPRTAFAVEMPPSKRKSNDPAHGEHRTKKPKGEPAINRVPQEIWDNVLQHIWSPPDLRRTFNHRKQWLFNIRLASKVFYNATNEAFIRQSIESPYLILIAHEIRKFLDGLNLIEPKDGRPIGSYIKCLQFFDHRRKVNSSWINALPPLSPADTVALRAELRALIDRVPQVQEIRFQGISSNYNHNTCNTPTEGLGVLLHLLSQASSIKLTTAKFRDCDIDFKLIRSFLASQPSLESLLFHDVFLLNGQWGPMFAYWRDFSPILTRLELFLIGDTTSSWGGGLNNDWATYNGPFPIRAFRNPTVTDLKTQVESYSLHPSAGIVIKGRFAVVLGMNTMLGNKGSALFDPSITVPAFKERGLLL
ncbi:hypothetical protein CERZMDRAFT_87283 [Cercospora zeae-maydis SCOH1-5]|uniref:Uncharacterized protein n=1 Tax=Cercospora zeae-maydis SCOH1-5 TaxID=717836 RepID=A0A6A6F5A9_9PEZI|nr:hypothetical protein CERZMDRAFT_87283 [Cercospora zeae-maydis SCOH1-5]